MPYYHATWAENLPSIVRNGLGGGVPVKVNFEWSEPGVYLSVDPVIAFGFLLEAVLTGSEPPKDPPHKALEKMKVIVIDDSRVDPSLLIDDPHVNCQDLTKLYKGIIDITGMPILGHAILFPEGQTGRAPAS